MLQVVRHGSSILASLTNSSILLEGQLIEAPGMGNGTSECSDESRMEEFGADFLLTSQQFNGLGQLRPSPVVVRLVPCSDAIFGGVCAMYALLRLTDRLMCRLDTLSLQSNYRTGQKKLLMQPWSNGSCATIFSATCLRLFSQPSWKCQLCTLLSTSRFVSFQLDLWNRTHVSVQDGFDLFLCLVCIWICKVLKEQAASTLPKAGHASDAAAAQYGNRFTSTVLLHDRIPTTNTYLRSAKAGLQQVSALRRQETTQPDPSRCTSSTGPTVYLLGPFTPKSCSIMSSSSQNAWLKDVLVSYACAFV